MKTTRNQGTLDKNIQLLEYEFPTCESMKYLGVVVAEKNDTTVEINARKVAGNRCVFSVQKILYFRILSRNVKLLIYKTIIRPVMMYASEM
jgi:hypothetical protein